MSKWAKRIALVLALAAAIYALILSPSLTLSSDLPQLLNGVALVQHDVNENSDQATFRQNLAQWVKDHPKEEAFIAALEKDGFIVQQKQATGRFPNVLCEVEVSVRWQAGQGRVNAADGEYSEICL